MNEIVSFSLYGHAPFYCEGALRNVELAKSIYPGWRRRFYIDDTVPARQLFLRRLRDVRSLWRDCPPHHGLYSHAHRRDLLRRGAVRQTVGAACLGGTLRACGPMGKGFGGACADQSKVHCCFAILALYRCTRIHK